MRTAPHFELTHAQKQRLFEDAAIALPNEICGILGGSGGKVAHIFPITNISSQPHNSFFMEPLELLNVLETLDACGWELLAVYHSHPPGERSDPSSHDTAHASYPGALQVIIVPGDGGGVPSLRAFEVTDNKVSEVEIRSGNTLLLAETMPRRRCSK